eukprot:2336164-Prymnesium_polylepis.1
MHNTHLRSHTPSHGPLSPPTSTHNATPDPHDAYTPTALGPPPMPLRTRAPHARQHAAESIRPRHSPSYGHYAPHNADAATLRPSVDCTDADPT